MSSPSRRKTRASRDAHQSHQSHQSHHAHHAEHESAGATDAAIYGAFALVGAFIAFLAAVFFEGDGWEPIVIGYIIAVAFLVHRYAIQAYLGQAVKGWQRALARLPLRFVGFGARGAKPLDAAKGEPRAKLAIIVSIAIWLVIIAIVTMLLLPQTRLWS